MTVVHIVIGCLALGLNLLAFLLGTAAWLRKRPSPLFWRLLRAGQLMVVVEAVFGGVLVLAGTRPQTCTTCTGRCRSWCR